MNTLTTRGSILEAIYFDLVPETVPQLLGTVRSQLSVDENHWLWSRVVNAKDWVKILQNAGEHFDWALGWLKRQDRKIRDKAIALAPDLKTHLSPAPPKLKALPKRLPQVRGNGTAARKPQEPYYQFRTREEFKKECLEGSAIASDFWDVAIEVIEDQEIDPYAHEVASLPIFDALNQEKYIRFPRKIEAPLIAGKFLQCTGETFQLKLNRPRGDYRKLDANGNPKPIKYESPKGVGARAFTPPIPEVVQRRNLDNLGLHPLETDQKLCDPAWFWQLVEAHPEWDIVITEGPKKGLAGLSQGHITIALTGCHGGYVKDKDTGEYSLNPDLIPFAVKGRKIILAFDQDSKSKTRRTVAKAQKRLAKLLQDHGCIVAIATWEPSQGKGIDDLVVQSGADAFHHAIATTIPFDIWERQNAYELALWIVANKLGRHTPDLVLNTPDLGWELTRLQTAIPAEGTVVLASATGTGKTNLLAELLRHLERVLAPGHRQSLQRGLATRLWLDYITDTDFAQGWVVGADGRLTRRLSLCWDSLLKIREEDYPPGSYTIALDEADQGFRHLILGGTCGKKGKRPGLLAKAHRLIKNAKCVILASAGISEAEIDLVLRLRGEEKAYVVKNEYKSPGYQCTLYTDIEKGDRRLAWAEGVKDLKDSLEKGDRCLVHLDTKADCYQIEALGLLLGLKPEEILRFDGDTSADPRQRKFAENPDKFLTETNTKLLVASPSLTSGVSIEVEVFDQVFAFFRGQSVAPSEGMQMPMRYRHLVPRTIVAPRQGKPVTLSPKNHLDYQTKSQRRSHMIAHVLEDADLQGQIDTDSPFAQYVAAVETDCHYEMLNYALYLQAYLENAGHQVTMGELPTEDDVADTLELMGILRKTVKEQRHQAIADAPEITPEHADRLRDKTTRLYKESLQLERFEIGAFYDEPVTPELVDFDGGGRARKGLNRMLGCCLPDFARDRDWSQLDKLTAWNEPIPMHDLPHRTVGMMALVRTGLLDLIAWVAAGNRWDKNTERIIECQKRCVENAADIKLATGLWVTPNQDPCQFFNMILRYFSGGVLTTESKREGSQAGGKDNRIWVYWLNPESMEKARYYLKKLADRYLQSTDKPIRPHPLSRGLLPGVALSYSSSGETPPNEQDLPDNPKLLGASPPDHPLPTPAIA